MELCLEFDNKNYSFFKMYIWMKDEIFFLYSYERNGICIIIFKPYRFVFKHIFSLNYHNWLFSESSDFFLLVHLSFSPKFYDSTFFRPPQKKGKKCRYIQFYEQIFLILFTRINFEYKIQTILMLFYTIHSYFYCHWKSFLNL